MSQSTQIQDEHASPSPSRTTNRVPICTSTHATKRSRNAREIEALAERLLARSSSKLSCDRPELQRASKMAAGLIALMARLPDVD
jgi:hypothetical protein